jgi:hypothetical protein
MFRRAVKVGTGAWRATRADRQISAASVPCQDMVALDLGEIQDLTQDVLLRAGCSPEHASACADVVMRAEQDLSISHGLFRVPGYAAALRSGKV